MRDVDAAPLEARWHLARKDHAAARAAVEAGLAESPDSVGLWVARSHVLLAQDAPPAELEAAFRAVLEVDQTNAQARHNLRVVLRNTGRSVEGVIDPPPT
jgi:predicted O-linked N-acetylglucosamine transferase (SPINDLY family)